MVEQITEGKFGSTELFDELENLARLEIQRWMQKLLEEGGTLSRCVNELKAA